MWLKRPWRWLVSVLGAALLLGLVFQIGRAIGAPAYLGLPTIGRFILFFGGATGLSLFVVPSYESVERDNEPLPPLPESLRPRDGASQSRDSHRAGASDSDVSKSR